MYAIAIAEKGSESDQSVNCPNLVNDLVYTSTMDDLSFIERLALLPQFDPERRTAAHVQGQKSYAKLYASEGRTYMSSWRQGDGTHSGDEIKCPVNKPANIDIGTPVLKPRVEKPAKSADPSKAKKLKATTKTVITVESSNHNEKDQKKRTTMKSKKTADAKVEKSKQKTVPPRKKRVVEESPSESSRAERKISAARLHIRSQSYTPWRRSEGTP